MTPELGRAGFRIGCLITVPCALLLVLLEPGTAAHTTSMVTLVMGMVFLIVVAVLVYRSMR